MEDPDSELRNVVGIPDEDVEGRRKPPDSNGVDGLRGVNDEGRGGRTGSLRVNWVKATTPTKYAEAVPIMIMLSMTIFSSFAPAPIDNTVVPASPKIAPGAINIARAAIFTIFGLRAKCPVGSLRFIGFAPQYI